MKSLLLDIKSYMLCTKDWLFMQQGLGQYLEKQYAQSHSDMLVMRGVQHIHLGQCVREGIEHIQYPRLQLLAMEVQPPERIRSHVHQVLGPWGSDEHSFCCVNDNPLESVRDSVQTQVRQLVCDSQHLARCQPCPRHRVRSDAQLLGVIITHMQTQCCVQILHIRALLAPGPTWGTQAAQTQVPEPPALSTYQIHSASLLCLCQVSRHQVYLAVPQPRPHHGVAMADITRDLSAILSVYCLPHRGNAANVGCPLHNLKQGCQAQSMDLNKWLACHETQSIRHDFMSIRHEI